MRSTLTNLANMFRVPDLRNKVLFTLVHHRDLPPRGQHPLSRASTSTPSSRWRPRRTRRRGQLPQPVLRRRAHQVRGVRARDHALHHRSIIIQLLMVVIPKFEQWRDEGAVGQKKLTQVTRYLTIALAVIQSTGLAYVFHNGGGGLLGGGTSLNIDLIPNFTVPRVLLIVLTMTAGTVVVMWLGELITQRGIGQGMSVLIFTNVVADHACRWGVGQGRGRRVQVRRHHRPVARPPGRHRVHRAGPAADPGHLRQTGGGPAHVRRPEHLHPHEGQHRRRGPDHLRQLGAVLPDPASPTCCRATGSGRASRHWISVHLAQPNDLWYIVLYGL